MSVIPSEIKSSVPRETYEKLETFLDIFQKWNSKINLIGSGTSSVVWSRHIADSLFMARIDRSSSRWLDLGSGGGFPGMVVAILYDLQRQVTLVESDKRKAVFLNTVRRELGLLCEIQRTRIEDFKGLGHSIISARALAPLPKLLALCSPLVDGDTTLILPKGRNWKEELDAVSNIWSFDLEVIDNPTDVGSVVLKFDNLVRV